MLIHRSRRAAGFLGVLFVAGIASLGLGVGTAPPAYAASDDTIDSMQIGYTVTPDGVLEVTETIIYRFGPDSGRHGIFRDLITREPYVDDTTKDQLYEVSGVAVSSPSGDSAQFTQETTTSDNGRDEAIQLQIGDGDVTIDAATATYVISYEVRGALRHFDDHSELYWDATGTAWEADMTAVQVTAAVPQGVTEVACFTGANSSGTPCTSATVQNGTGAFTQATLPAGEGLTIVASIQAGAVTNDRPLLAEVPGLLTRAGVGVPALVGAGAVSLLAPAAAAAYARSGNRDQRFAGPPGTVPTGAGGPVAKDALRTDQLPVAFAPPKIPPAAGGYLVDATINTLETAATLIDLAVRGAVRIVEADGEQTVELLDRSVATAPHERALLEGMLPNERPGDRVPLTRGKVGDKRMFKAHTRHRDALQTMAKAAGWYARPPDRNRTTAKLAVRRNLFIAVVVVGFIAFQSVTFTALSSANILKAAVIGVPVFAAVVAVFVWRRTAGRGTRSGLGRALTDQAEGFRRYLATAEAAQLRFEEGEDIFSRYLPWAIAFDLADRWQKVCAELVAQGRIPDDPGWYYGPSIYHSAFTMGALSHSMTSTFSAPPTPASSGGGGGSSSGFSGGSSGGGGGGGGGGSW